MFTCSLSELVVHGQNGFVFENYRELADQLIFWFENFPNNPSLLESKEVFRRNLEEFQAWRWNHNWNSCALQLFQKWI